MNTFRVSTFVAVGIALLTASGCRAPQVAPAPPADPHVPYNYVGTKAMVVAAHPLAAEAGLAMLKAGGNAVDAAVATAFALNAAEPFASGLGGGGFMVVHMARTGKTTVVNFREKAPAAAKPTMYAEKGEARDEWRTVKGTAVGVPGMLAGWSYALGKYGTKSLAQAAARAIEIAETGFRVSATFSNIDKEEYDKILKNAGESSCYLNGGLPYEPGDLFRNPDLARTLRTIAAKGTAEFYRGEIARKIVAAVQGAGGSMTLDDLASYAPAEVEPLRGTYKGYEIRTAPPPATGGLHLLQLLAVTEGWPLKDWGQNSVPAIHHLAEATRFLFADKDRYDADPDSVPVPVRDLLAPPAIARIRSAIRPDKVAGAYPYSRFDPLQEKKESTTHVSVVDAEGNIVALTQSIQNFFGTGLVPEGTGFLLNDQLGDFSIDPKSPNAPDARRRPVSNMTPLILFRDGRPVLTIGSPGGTRIFPSMAQILLNIIDFGMPLDEAIESPRFFAYSSEGKPRPLSVESRFPPAAIEALKALGHSVTVREAYDKYFGGAQGIMILPGGGLRGGADSRRDGVGRGYRPTP
jgi:gamma-glutamyltranspeptidase / glutathione hydrolase